MDSLPGPIGAVIALMTSGAMMVVSLGLYVYAGYCFMVVANKLNVPNGWLGFVPIGNLYLATQCAKVDWWWMLVMIFAPIIPIAGAIAAIGVGFWLLWRICENRGKAGAMCLLILVPIIGPLALYGLLAFTD